jgi:hypothetical protein
MGQGFIWVRGLPKDSKKNREQGLRIENKEQGTRNKNKNGEFEMYLGLLYLCKRK